MTGQLACSDLVSALGKRSFAAQTGAEPAVVVVPTAQCAAEPAQRWFIDGRGGIHCAALPTKCLTSTVDFGGRVTLAACNNDSLRQTWSYGADTSLTWAAVANRVLDFDRTNSSTDRQANRSRT